MDESKIAKALRSYTNLIKSLDKNEFDEFVDVIEMVNTLKYYTFKEAEDGR